MFIFSTVKSQSCRSILFFLFLRKRKVFDQIYSFSLWQTCFIAPDSGSERNEASSTIIILLFFAKMV
jgi:hypothetical protein